MMSNRLRSIRTRSIKTTVNMVHLPIYLNIQFFVPPPVNTVLRCPSPYRRAQLSLLLELGLPAWHAPSPSGHPGSET